MQLKNAPNDVQSMSQDGDAILRSLQNKSLPVIDLMVRESLQNSLDASLSDSQNTIVEFKTGSFENSKLAENFEGINDLLNERYSKNPSFLAVLDKNTTGLTGDYQSEDPNILNKSNFHKLVFGIGKNQEADGAGGSWGLGKTSYFRLGIGIVIYYTRVLLDNGNYEERLIASLIESPKQKNRLLPNNGRGIAWWGEFSQEDESNRILPLTNEDDIESILSIFEIPRYTDKETGTAIIIPYLGNNEIYSIDRDENDEQENTKVNDEIKLAVQRWYNPRLANQAYVDFFERPNLVCGVNFSDKYSSHTVGIIPGHNTEPFFDIMGDLYTSALLGKPVEADSKIKVEPIILSRNAMKNPQKNPVGHIAFKEYSKEELKIMVPPHNCLSPLELLGIDDEEKINANNSKIIAYSRMPGMVVEYSVDGEWAPKSLIQKENHMILGFFVPNSKGELIERYQKEGYNTLEQYLRATENADHANWIDEDGFGIIRRMKEYSSKAINNYYLGDQADKQSSATSGLSRKFGKKLMPPKGFGKNSAKKENTNGGSKRNSGSKNRVSDISVRSSNPIDEHNVEVSFEASIKKESNNRIFLQVLSQEKKMNHKEWVKSFDTAIPFPFEIDGLYIESIDNDTINQNYTDFADENIQISQNEDEKFEILISSQIGQGINLKGIIKLHALDNHFIPNIAISSEVSNGGEA